MQTVLTYGVYIRSRGKCEMIAYSERVHEKKLIEQLPPKLRKKYVARPRKK